MYVNSQLSFLARRSLAVVASATALALASPAMAQGDLLIAPTRVVLSGGGSTQVILSNIGTTPATYRIALELRRMEADGDVSEVPEEQANPTERAALDMIRYAPRRITLAPNQPQSIRISARPPEGLADGEYRVHMSFRAVPDAAPTADPAAPAAPADPAPASGLTIRLTPIYGITIPLIVRKGQLDAGVTIARPQVVRVNDSDALQLELDRTGNRSVFGEIRVIAPGVADPVYLARGIAVYPEVTHRTVKLPLSAEQAARLKGPLRIEYRELPENGGKLLTSADANFK